MEAKRLTGKKKRERERGKARKKMKKRQIAKTIPKPPVFKLWTRDYIPVTHIWHQNWPADVVYVRKRRCSVCI